MVSLEIFWGAALAGAGGIGVVLLYAINVRGALDAFKLEIAKEYASVVHLKEVEQRLAAELHTMNRMLSRLNDSVVRLLGARDRDGYRPPGPGGE